MTSEERDHIFQLVEAALDGTPVWDGNLEGRISLRLSFYTARFKSPLVTVGLQAKRATFDKPKPPSPTVEEALAALRAKQPIWVHPATAGAWRCLKNWSLNLYNDDSYEVVDLNLDDPYDQMEVTLKNPEEKA